MRRRGNLIAHAVLAVCALWIALPLLWVLHLSFLPETQSNSLDLPTAVTLENYVKLLVEDRFWRAAANSLAAASLSTLLALPFAATLGYALARYRSSGQAGRFLLLLLQLLPPIAMVLPVVALFMVAGFTDPMGGLVLAYAAVNLPFLTWVLIGFFERVPAELEWAAMSDGATAWGAFWRIALPVARPGLAVAALSGFILAWNEFLFALVLTDGESETIPVALTNLQSRAEVPVAELSAGIVLGVLPMLGVLALLRHHLLHGRTFGAIR
ncbi:carbohydrate ABC transporter permease [Dongia sp.]|uniref:carbohydrate ABC transporter permease n=1 Tax=Dongia sp. TaxID=1977262 RepID=UPI0037503696